MSEKEKLQRDNYQRRRKGWIIFQSIIIGIVTLVLAFGSYTYYKLNQITIINNHIMKKTV